MILTHTRYGLSTTQLEQHIHHSCPIIPIYNFGVNQLISSGGIDLSYFCLEHGKRLQGLRALIVYNVGILCEFTKTFNACYSRLPCPSSEGRTASANFWRYHFSKPLQTRKTSPLVTVVNCFEFRSAIPPATNFACHTSVFDTTTFPKPCDMCFQSPSTSTDCTSSALFPNWSS